MATKSTLVQFAVMVHRVATDRWRKLMFSPSKVNDNNVILRNTSTETQLALPDLSEQFKAMV